MKPTTITDRDRERYQALLSMIPQRIIDHLEKYDPPQANICKAMIARDVFDFLAWMHAERIKVTLGEDRRRSERWLEGHGYKAQV